MAAEQSEIGPTLPNAPQSVRRAAPLRLELVYPPALAGTLIELSDGLTLGREPQPESPSSRHFVISHATVSRRHAAIQSGFGVAYLRDLGSSNGTHVNGVALARPSALEAQCVVRFGDVLAVIDEHAELDVADASLAALPGRSARVARMRALVARAAPRSDAVLILGETGTGKEWLAADIHRASGRQGPYLKLSCAELSPQLIESQLFGHERGAFTGADSRHSGLFQAAHRGTLFLDEVGELPLESQAKLLRVLQEGEVRPVGSVKTYRTDVRVVCATNRDLVREVAAGRFRQDLLARLAVFELELPPLRERRQDILDWLERLATRAGCVAGAIQWQPAVAERLLLHPWPDNLRGLHRLVQRLAALGDKLTVGTQLLREVMPELCDDLRSLPATAAASDAPLAPEPAAQQAVPPGAQPTREEFLAVYEATGRNVRATSKHFGRDRRQIYRWLESFGIER